jgi:transposase-like protein
LYRAVDSTGQTIDFLLTGKRDTAAAKRFFRQILKTPANRMPRVINVDQNPAYPAAVRCLRWLTAHARAVGTSRSRQSSPATERSSTVTIRFASRTKRVNLAVTNASPMASPRWLTARVLQSKTRQISAGK